MSALLPLDRRGFKLGFRPEKHWVPKEKSTWDLMDTRLSFLGRKLLSKRTDIEQFNETLKSIHHVWDQACKCTDEELMGLWLAKKDVAARCACIAEFIFRETGLRAHDVQLYAAWRLRNTKWLEMATGEGKSLVAALAAAWVASEGVRVHVLTTNEYLVSRDAQLYQSVFQRAGLSSSCVLQEQTDDARRQAYKADVVYLTGKQSAFD